MLIFSNLSSGWETDLPPASRFCQLKQGDSDESWPPLDAVNQSEMLETDVAEAPVLDVAAEAASAPEVQVNDVQGGAGVDTHLGRYRADTKEGGAAMDCS